MKPKNTRPSTCEIIETSELNSRQLTRIVAMWNEAYPVALRYDNTVEFQQYLSETPLKTHYLAVSNNEILGWLMTFQREDTRWFALLIDPQHHRQGIGGKLLHHVKKLEFTLHAWAINHNDYQLEHGAPYLSPIAFYEKHDFQIFPDRKFVNEKISAIRILWEKS